MTVLQHRKIMNRDFAVIFVMVFVNSMLHYLTPVSLPYMHEIYRRLYYIPIIIAGVKYRIWGGLATSVITALVYLPHIVFQWEGGFLVNLVRFTEIFLFIVVGFLAGYLSNSVYLERNRYKNAAEKLEVSYKKIKRQTEQLTEMKTELLAADRLSVMGELTASLAHEVRNPLGSIKGAASILKKRCPGDKTAQKFALLLDKEVARLNQVVENYLSLVRRSVDHQEQADLKAMIISILELVGPEIRKKQIQIHTTFSDRPLIVRMQEIEVRQVFLNMVLNALDAMDNGGHLNISGELDGGRIKAIVSDTGKGIPASQIDKVFEPFVTTKPGGTGLGLSIVKRIMESHGGSIDVESKENMGTTIILRFQKAG